MRRIRVLIAEDRPIVAEGLQSVLTAVQDVDVVAIVATRLVAIEAPRSRPAVIIADPANKVLHAHYEWGPRFVALSAIEDIKFMHALFQSGVHSYVCLRSPPQDIIRAIRAAVADEIFFDSVMATSIAGSMRNDRGVQALSSRELAVVKLIARGLRDKEIAYDLGVSIKSVSSYKYRAMAKLGIRSRAEIVQLAIENNWLVEKPMPCRQ